MGQGTCHSFGLQRVEIIEPLRGLAAFAVMWFHFTCVGTLFPVAEGAAGWMRASGAHGWLGVEVFFVISGFILPFSMFRSRYDLSDFTTFVKKRVIRLDPPYLATIALALALWYLSALVPGFRGEPFSVEPVRLLMHIGYLNALVGDGWYNPVFWTLAIEFQFYLLIALAYPLIAHPRPLMRTTFPLILAASAWLPLSDTLVFRWLGLFALGMVVFQAYCGLSSRRRFAALVGILTVINAATLGWLISLVGLLASVVIAFVRIPSIAPLAFLGTISYSLYLVHVPIGSRLINFGVRFADSLPSKLAVLLCATLASLGVAYAMHRWIEKPAQRWSSAIRYRAANRPSEQGLVTVLPDPKCRLVGRWAAKVAAASDA